MNTSLPDKEKNKQPPEELSWPVRYSWYSFSSKEIMAPHDYLGVVKNFSHNGLCFVAEDPPPKGSLVELRISVPKKGLNFEALGCVIRITTIENSKYEIGTELFAVDNIGKEEINRYLDKKI